MKLLKNAETGRSMIEMLGVLAIVGILSVGGIAGFSQAMNKHKTIKEIEKYNLFVQDMMQYKDQILKSGDTMGSSSFVYFTKDVKNIGILPDGWRVVGSNIKDTMGHTFNLYSDNKRTHIVMGLYINDKKEQKADMVFCMQMWQNFILPNKEWIGNVWVNGSGGKSGNYYGTQFCSPNKKCLSEVTIGDISAFCNSCAEETVCNIITTFQ